MNADEVSGADAWSVWPRGSGVVRELGVCRQRGHRARALPIHRELIHRLSEVRPPRGLSPHARPATNGAIR
ncbi:hypothetical protein ACFQ0X_40750 [Streptomyces rectiviolaceus]|uniref:hypothetical protein n=1 Tax=Streptomyces rectiviolaceus TaxID=332591 RepID=UPI0031D80CB0